MGNNVFSPSQGFAQSTYYDQQATAIAGMLANASDYRLTDSLVVRPPSGVDGTNGLVAGVGVVVTNQGAAHDTDTQRDGINPYACWYPVAASTAADVWGIAVRNQQMDSNSSGQACWFPGRMCNVLRLGRVGGRIWVRIAYGSAATTKGSPVYMVTADTAATGKQIGAFTAAAVSGDTLELPNIIWLGSFTAPATTTGIALGLVELIPQKTA